LTVTFATDKGEKSHLVALDDCERKAVKADFTYDEAEDAFHCPVKHCHSNAREQTPSVFIRAMHTPVRPAHGIHVAVNRVKGRHAGSITTDDKEPLWQQMNSKMQPDEAKAVYKQRKVIVEPVFGQIKNSGFRGFSVRGKNKVAGEFSLVCATHNLKNLPGPLPGEWSVRNLSQHA